MQTLAILIVAFAMVKFLRKHGKGAMNRGQALVQAYQAIQQGAKVEGPRTEGTIPQLVGPSADAHTPNPWEADDTHVQAAPAMRRATPVSVASLSPSQAANVVLWLASETKWGRDGRGVSRYDVRRLMDCVEAVKANAVDTHVVNVATHLATRYRKQIAKAGTLTTLGSN